ncbi:DUF1127 domain-containing protein [Thalassococcus sp. CAU 1522]|uniref:DUF1127 domain-containing protein n=1 Tax=Thalassococcus arenae TaxID=2851652 RepID=A0ABS6N7E5_9RHOB|nr:DUF1127 domain-containing protein [Thalassococcus arenae]MBV2359944.1 DUF1127 domain-containing protein [Thalassococcus arenae]
MAALDTTRPFAAAGSAGRSAGIFATLVGAFAAWNDARLTRKSLSALTDRELDDIGLCRGDIDTVSYRY